MPSTKGSTFKGPFHVPRALSMTERMLTEIIGDSVRFPTRLALRCTSPGPV